MSSSPTCDFIVDTLIEGTEDESDAAGDEADL